VIHTDSVIAIFEDHESADAAIKELADAGFPITHLSVVGQGYHSEEKVVGFYNSGDRIKFWGTRGAFWGGLWSFFFGGIFMTVPLFGPVVALGYLATLLVATLEGAVVVGGLSAIGAALYNIGIPKDSVIDYETALKTDGLLVMAHGTAAEMSRAKKVLSTTKHTRLDTHANLKPVIAKA